MRTLKLLMVSVLLVAAPASFTGCVGPRTTEAVVFDSFKTTYNAAYSAYTGWLELVVTGRASKADEARVDAAWNEFRAGFSLSFQAASNDWSAATPEKIQLLSEQLIRLIHSL